MWRNNAASTFIIALVVSFDEERLFVYVPVQKFKTQRVLFCFVVCVCVCVCVRNFKIFKTSESNMLPFFFRDTWKKEWILVTSTYTAYLSPNTYLSPPRPRYIYIPHTQDKHTQLSSFTELHYCCCNPINSLADASPQAYVDTHSPQTGYLRPKELDNRNLCFLCWQSEAVNYALSVGNYTKGNYIDVLSNLNGRPFSTFDNDNDDWSVQLQASWLRSGCPRRAERPKMSQVDVVVFIIVVVVVIVTLFMHGTSPILAERLRRW